MAYDPNQPEDPQTAAMFAQWARVFMAHLQSRGLLNLPPAGVHSLFNPSDPYNLPEGGTRDQVLGDRAYMEHRNSHAANLETEMGDFFDKTPLPDRTNVPMQPELDPRGLAVADLPQSTQQVTSVGGPAAGIDNQNDTIRNPLGGAKAE